MTTTDEAFGAGDLDSVASLLVNDPVEDEDQDDEAALADDADADEAEPDDLPEDEAQAEDDGEQDEADDDEDDGGEELSGTVRVKVDGEEIEVTLDDLKRAYAGQGYIQKRMREVAEVRKEAEAVYTALNQERAQLAQTLAAYQQQMQQVGMPQKPSKELLESDPITYFEKMEAYREATEAHQAREAQRYALERQQAELSQRAHMAVLQEQAQLLAQAIPEFADAEKAGKLKQDIVRSASNYGFSPEELGGVVDARQVQVLYDAMRYRQLMAGKQKVTEKVANARPVIKPGVARTATQGKKAAADKVRARMKQTGSVDDVAAFLSLKG
jgi:hypothetical protein